MVAPNGNTKLVVFLEMPALSRAHFIVTGNVAPEEQVENAFEKLEQ